MKTTPVIPRELAHRDVEDATAYYLTEGSPSAALGPIDELEKAYAHISRHPATGSLKYAHELNLPGLRVWHLTRYPHFVFTSKRRTTSIFGACCTGNALFLLGYRPNPIEFL